MSEGTEGETGESDIELIPSCIKYFPVNSALNWRTKLQFHCLFPKVTAPNCTQFSYKAMNCLCPLPPKLPKNRPTYNKVVKKPSVYRNPFF
jgi:hypothetical protein